MRIRLPIFSLLILLIVASAPSGTMADEKAADDSGSSQKLPALFDPARHMRVDEVRPGMKGYGLTVFSGTKIERFGVEVVSILHNFNPKYDVILIRCDGEKIEHTGPVQGMSGSPIFLRDDAGHDRIIGAFAYGWPLVKDALAGVQPIQYMLSFPTRDRPADAAANDDLESSAAPKAIGNIRWSLLDSPEFRAMISTSVRHENLVNRLSNSPLTNELQPLATPLFCSGVPSRLVEQLAPIFKRYGLTLVQGGGSAGDALARAAQDVADASGPVKLEPGSVLAAPLLTGDSELSAIGTCTEVIGDRVVGFGHPFNNEGPIALPLATGQIQAVIAKLDQSFKIGSAGKLVGTLTNDQIFGVAGKIGPLPPTMPIDVHVSYADGSQDLNYHYDAAVHPKLTPLLVTVALATSITSARDLPQNHTIEYSMKVDFANGQSIDLSNIAANVEPAMLFTELSLPIGFVSDNPFQRIAVKRVSAKVTITPQAKQAQILSVNLPKLKFRPGETLKGFVSYRPFRAPEGILPIELELPRDLPDGPYRLAVSDSQRYLADQVLAEPFRFSAENAAQIFQVVNDVTSIRHDAIYARLMRQSDGVAMGRVAMPKLPSSRRQVILDSGRSNATAFVSSSVKRFPTGYVMDGSADFEITIDSEAHVEVGSPAKNATKVEPANTPPPTAVNPADEKPKPGEKSENLNPQPPSTQR